MAKQAIVVTTDFDLNKITLDLTKELNRAGEIIHEDHFQRLERGQGVKGALVPSKKASGKTLVNTGKMRNLVTKKATKQKQEVNLYPGRKQTYPGTNVTMSDVGEFHQFGAGNLPVREWFGVTTTTEKRIVKMLELEIERQIRRA